MKLENRILENIRASGLRTALTTKWKEAIDKGYLEMTEPDSLARPLFVGLQAIIEQSIAEAIAEGDIKSAVNIVHTPKPVNPFAQEVSDARPYNDLDALYNDLEGDTDDVEGVFGPDAAAYVKIRRKVLEDFTRVGGVVVSAYPAGTELSAAYQDNVERLDGGLVDHPVEGLDPALTGATLVVEDNDGLTTVFSMNAFQMQTAGDAKDKTWKVWFGQPEDNADVKMRLADIQIAVETQKVSLNRWAEDSAAKIELNAA